MGSPSSTSERTPEPLRLLCLVLCALHAATTNLWRVPSPTPLHRPSQAASHRRRHHQRTLPPPTSATLPRPFVLAERAPLWPRTTALAFDSTRGQVLLIGGLGATISNDTWAWDGAQWSRKQSNAMPATRAGAAASPKTRITTSSCCLAVATPAITEATRGCGTARGTKRARLTAHPPALARL